MGLDVYFRKDIGNVLQGLGSAEAAAVKNQDQPLTQVERGYHEGFKAALVAMGLCFGLGPMVSHWRSDGPVWIEADQ